MSNLVDRSMFALTPGRMFYIDLWENQVLFWSVILGMVTVLLRKHYTLLPRSSSC